MRAIKILLKILKFLAELTILLAAGFLMLYLAYYFGWSLLTEGRQWGNDLPSALNNVYYLAHWYPPIPKWIHLWAGGMPFLRIYPSAPFLLTFLIHKLTALSIEQVARLVMLFSIPLAATGVATLGRVLTKSWWVGILAGVLMILSPDSWFWITMGGFYAMAASVPLFAWTLVFFCLALEKRSAWLSSLAALFYGLTWLFHPTAGALAAVVMAILGLGFGARFYGLRQSWKGIAKAAVIGVVGILLLAWWIFPFLTREDIGGISMSAEQMYRDTIREIVGLDPAAGTYITGTFFTASAVILFIVGVFVAFFRKSILRWAVLACGIALFIMTAPYYAQPVVKAFALFWAATNVRAALILRILGPIIGAYGAVSLTRPFFWLIEKLVESLRGNKLWGYATESVGGVVGILVFLLLLKNLIIIPPDSEFGEDFAHRYSGFGPYRNWLTVGRVDGEEMILDEKTDKFTIPLFKDHKAILEELSEISSRVGEKQSLTELIVKAAVDVSGVTNKQRIDVIPLKGDISGALGNYSQVAQIPAYLGTSLVQRMVGWQIDCTYYNPLCGPAQIADLSRWWGVTQVWQGREDPTPLAQQIKERLGRVGLLEPERIYLGKISKADVFWNLYRFQDSTGLASITNKPTVLIIGDNPPNNDVFDIVFRGLTKADFGYRNAWSVKGRRFIDDYRLKELSQFEALVLHGYQYRNRERAWGLLKQYVNQGGKLFVDTGWQWISKDWGKEVQGEPAEVEMPEILPVERTLWRDIEGGWDLGLGAHQITEEVGLDDWGDPLWRGKPWGAALAEKEWLRPGATALLENQGKILAASWEYGSGKVVWTGFDFWGHLVEYQASDERRLVRNILDWLVGAKSWEKELDFQREKPDLIRIDFSQGSGRSAEGGSASGGNKLMFKEVASDNWIATLDGKNLPIYKAGPGWKMIFLPDQPSSGEIVFSYRRNKVEWFGIFTSVLTAILALFYLVSKLIRKDWDERLLVRIRGKLEKKAIKMKEDWKDEEE